MRIDVNVFLGEYPYRRIPGGSPAGILSTMGRIGVDEAWVSDISAMFWRDPTEANALLFETSERHSRLRPVPAIHPGLEGWRAVLRDAVKRGAPCVRCDPTFYGLSPAGNEMRALVAACGEARVPLMLAVRLEDRRQRHPNDAAPELEPWAVRSLIRAHPRARLIVTHADRDFIEQVHFGSTPGEASRVLWDICWIWGPPEDHLELLLGTVGLERFTFGTGMPLRLPETSIAKLDLLDLRLEERAAIEEKNLVGFLGPA